jgi:glucose/arabinose dehydrogenase
MWKKVIGFVLALVCSRSFVHAGRCAAQPPTLALARPQDQSRFRVTTFATGLSFPTSMTTLADGSLLVAESAGSMLWTSTTSRLVRLVDTNADGVADGPPQVLAGGSDLPGMVTSVRRVGGLVVALSSQTARESITFWRTGASPSSPLTAVGRLAFSFPTGTAEFGHTTYALAARPAISDPTSVEVYFNVGARGNSESTPMGVTVGLAASGTSIQFQHSQLAADSVHRIVVGDAEEGFTVSTPVQIARGLRNAAGMAFDAAGNLCLQDNGIDTPGNPNVSFSADEFNRIPAASLGQTVYDFGFAETYIRYSDGVLVENSPPNADAVAPLIAFRPIDGRKSEGAVEIAFAPASFGEDFSTGCFVAFHGIGGLSGTANTENPVVFADPSNGSYFHFVDNQLLGHPNGLLATADSLFVSDLSWTGSVDGAVDGVPPDMAGVIYQITAVPEPSSIVFVVSGMLAVAVFLRNSVAIRRDHTARCGCPAAPARLG